jgi:ABC-type enterochelin transport system permease subunit
MEIITSVVMPVVGILITALTSYIVWFLQEEKKETKEIRKTTAGEFDAIKEGLKELLLDSIAQAHEKHVMKDERLTVANFNRIEGIYNAYKKLGGNGGADMMWKEIKGEKLDGGI